MDPIERLARDPAHSALLLDVDGALAPIVPRPDDARVPDATRTELERLRNRYALVACITGRTVEDARQIVGMAGLEYVGVHGLEGNPDAERWRGKLHELLAETDWPEADTEDKGVTASFHFRRVEDEASSLARVEEIAARARDSGLVPHHGRKVLEIRPPVDADKGTAVQSLLAGRALTAALYAGDDTTDLDAFRGLSEAGLELAVRVAVLSDESPPELREQANMTVDGPDGLLDLLREL